MKVDLWGAAVRHVLYPTWERRVRRRPTLDLLAELRRSERASLAELRARQLSELQRLVAHAEAAVPHYRERFANAGVRADEVRSLADLRRLPILSRQEARASVDTRLSETGPAPAVTKTTGGTTGEPLVIRYDIGSEHWRQAMRLRGFSWAGHRVGDVSVHYWGEPSKPNRALATVLKQRVDRALKREHYVDCTPRGDEHKAAVVELLRRVKPTAMMCYAQAGADLARYVNRTRSRAWDTIAVICGAEKVYPDDRAALEEAFGPAVYETYGCREFMLIATECSAHDGLHVSMENLIVELCDDAGQPVPPGEVGQVVITDLHNRASPFIRYANGDLAVAVPDDEPCPCGRAHTRLRSIEGRKTETLVGADGSPVGGMVFNLLFSPLADEVDQFQAVQHADRSITLKVVSKSELSPRVREHIDAQAARYLPGLRIDVEKVDDIPLTRSGKRRVVVVEAAEVA